MESAYIQPDFINPPAAAGDASRVWVEQAGPVSRLRREGAWLLLASAVLALSFGMPGLKSKGLWLALPCVFHSVTHLPCLTCGLTRSFVSTAHGDLAAALEFHLLGPALFMLVFASALYLAASLVTGRRVRFRLSTRSRRLAFACTLGVFITAWVLKVSFLKVTW